MSLLCETPRSPTSAVNDPFHAYLPTECGSLQPRTAADDGHFIAQTPLHVTRSRGTPGARWPKLSRMKSRLCETLSRLFSAPRGPMAHLGLLPVLLPLDDKTLSGCLGLQRHLSAGF